MCACMPARIVHVQIVNARHYAVYFVASGLLLCLPGWSTAGDNALPKRRPPLSDVLERLLIEQQAADTISLHFLHVTEPH